MFEQVERFYDREYFEQLVETPPFQLYLAEEQALLGEIDARLLLEVGCGGGRLFPVLAKQTGQLVGIEIAERQYQRARSVASQFKNVSVVHGDAADMPFPDDHFDAALMVWNLFGNLADQRDRVLAETLRVVKPGKKICLSVLSQEALEPYLEMLKVNNLTAEHVTEDKVFLREGLISERFSRKKLEKIFEQFSPSYQITQLTPIGYWCVVRKPD